MSTAFQLLVRGLRNRLIAATELGHEAARPWHDRNCCLAPTSSQPLVSLEPSWAEFEDFHGCLDDQAGIRTKSTQLHWGN